MIARIIPFLIIPLLAACLPKKPEINLPAVPAQPLMQALDQRRQSLSAFKAVASVELVRAGRRRAFDSVGILLDDQRRARMEVYGPLGQSLLTLVWNGPDVAVRRADGSVLRPGVAGIEKILGMPLDARELCAALSGNVPAHEPVETNAFREPDGGSVIQVLTSDSERRFHVLYSESPSVKNVWITAAELYRSGKLVYRVRYTQKDGVSEYRLPETVLIENPERKSSLKIVYEDTEVNMPLSEAAFVLSGAEVGVP